MIDLTEPHDREPSSGRRRVPEDVAIRCSDGLDQTDGGRLGRVTASSIARWEAVRTVRTFRRDRHVVGCRAIALTDSVCAANGLGDVAEIEHCCTSLFRHSCWPGLSAMTLLPPPCGSSASAAL